MRYTLFPMLQSQGGGTPSNNYGNSIIYAMTATTQTLNLTESTVTLDTEVQIDTNTYSTSSGVITVKETGTYLIINHAAMDRDTVGTNRTSGETFLHINGSLVTGAYTDGYIRRTTVSDEFSSCAYGIYELSANDTVEMRQLRINNAGSDGRIVGNVTTYIDAKTSISMIKLNNDNAMFLANGDTINNQTLSTNDTPIALEWGFEYRKDTGYTHSIISNQENITIADVGKYLLVYSDSWERDSSTTTRTGIYTYATLDGGVIPGSYSNNYIRGSQSAELIDRGNTSAATIFQTNVPNQVLNIKAAQEAGGLSLSRLKTKPRIGIYKLNGGEKSFRILSSSTENIGSTTEATMTYNAAEWTSSGLSLASNQITATSGSKFLTFQGTQAEGSVIQRCGTYQFGRYNSVNQKYGTCTSYIRVTGSMLMACPHWGCLNTISDSQTIEARMDSLQTTSSDILRQVNTSSFCGIDLNTLE